MKLTDVARPLRIITFIAFCALLLGACSLLGGEPDPELSKAYPERIVAPESARVGAKIAVEISGNTDCGGPLHHVEEARSGRTISFTFWTYKQGPPCPYAPHRFRVTRTLRFDQPGQYLLVAHTVSDTVTVE